MKKILALVLVFSMIFSVVGCSKNDSQTDKTGGTDGTGSKEEAVTINYYGRPDDQGVESTIVEMFEKENPNIKVNYVELPDSSNDKLKTINTVLQAGDSSIDVFVGDVIWPPIFASAGWVMPLDEFLNKGELEQYLSGPLSAFKINGLTYGLPFMSDAGTFFYRKDLLEKYNKPVPQSWEELIETSKYIMEKEENPELKGYVSSWKLNEGLTCTALEFIWATGSKIVDENGKSAIEVDKLEQAIQQMYDIIYTDEIGADGMSTFGTTELRATVTAGNVIFARDWPGAYTTYTDPEKSKVADKIGMGVLPGGHATLGGWGVMVSKFSENKEAAVEFAKFRANYESQIITHKLISKTPTIKAAFEDEAVLESAPYIKELLPIIESSVPRPITPFYAEVSAIIQLEVHSVVSNMSTPKEAAENIEKKVKELLQ